MSSNAQPQRRRMPQVWRYAIWHPTTGLITSPYSRTLPSTVVKNRISTKPRDFNNPRLLHDDNIYLAFYPRHPIIREPLFSVLAIPPNDLNNAILTQAGASQTRYILDPAIQTRWRNLETSLLEVAQMLYNEHPENRHFPHIKYPRWPHEYGYTDSHSTKEGALLAANRAITAFSMLAAFTSFSLALWLTEYEDDCLDKAMNCLTERSDDALPRVWLQYMRNSFVANFAPGLRPGGFLIPYETCWGRVIKYFVRASVPIWFVWGGQPNWNMDMNDNEMKKVFFPPARYIGVAQLRTAQFSEITLPGAGSSVDGKKYMKNGEIDYDSLPATGPPINFPDLVPPAEPRDNSTSYFGLPYHEFEQPDAYVEVVNVDEPPPPPPPVDRSAFVHSGSGQRNHETWPQFKARQEERQRRRIDTETPPERQKRESHEKYARERGYSNKSKIYVWNPDEYLPTFFRREEVTGNAEQIKAEWDDCPRAKRFFWGFSNQWDLCPHLESMGGATNGDASIGGSTEGDAPMGSAVDEYSDDSGDDWDDEQARIEHDKKKMSAMNVDAPSSLPPAAANRDLSYTELWQDSAAAGFKKPTGSGRNVAPLMLAHLRAITAQDVEPEESSDAIQFLPLVLYLRRRHGYDAVSADNWQPTLHDVNRYALKIDRGDLAVKNLLHVEDREDQQELSQPVRRSIVNFFNIVIREGRLYTDVPRPWDITQLSFRCDLTRIRLQPVLSPDNESVVYILRPPKGSNDPSSWFVALQSATAVLLVYRSPWRTMHQIARGLLDLGIPFRTVVERPRRARPDLEKYKTKGLGSRPRNFRPIWEDFHMYEDARSSILRSHYGRAVRLRGGLVGRFAADVVPNVDVLDGPLLAQWEVVGYTGNTEYIDDAVSDDLLDVICGVYMVNTRYRTIASHSSWWPKHGVWVSSGLHGDQWLPASEKWFADRQYALHRNQLELKTSSEWTTSLKLQEKQKRLVYEGSERLAANFLQYSSRGCGIKFPKP